MKKEKHVGIIAILLFLLIVGGFVATSIIKKMVSKETNEVKADSKFIYIDAEDDDWLIGEWRIASSVSALSDNISVDGSDVELTPDGESAKAKVTISGELYMGTLAEDIEPGLLAYELPRGLFEDQNYNDYEVTDGVGYFYNLDDELMYSITFGSDLPYCNPYNSTCESDTYDYYWYIANGKINIENAHAITVDSVQDNDYAFSISFTYEYTNDCDFGFDNKNYEVVVFIGDYDYSVKTFRTTVVGDNEEVSLDNIYGENPIIYEDWQSHWGDEPGTYDFYVEYQLGGFIEGGNDYVLELNAINVNGQLVAYSSDGDLYSIGNSFDYRMDDNNCYINGSGYADVYCSLIVGYNLNGATTMEAKYSVSVGYDNGIDYTEKQIDFNVQYGEEHGDDPTEVEYPSGYVKDFVIKNNNPTVFEGAINKLKNNEVSYDYLIEPSTGSINKTSSGNVKGFNLWNLTNEGTDDYTINIVSPSLNLDSTYSSDTNLQPLTSGEYYIKSLYLQDDIEYDYVLNDQETEYILQRISNYDNYTSKNIYISINGGEYQLIGTYRRTGEGTIAYTASDTSTTTNDNVTASNPIVLPANVTGVKLEYTGHRAAVYMGANIKNVLRSADTLNQKIEAIGSPTVLKNDATLYVNDNQEKTARVSANLTKIDTTFGTYVRDNKLDKISIDGVMYDDIKYEIGAYDSVNFAGNAEEVKEYLSNQAKGTFYVLLPLGGEIKDGMTVKTYGNKTLVASNVSYEENYEGTGRTLATIVITDETSDNYYVGDTSLFTGFMVEFEVLYSYRSNQNYGTNLDLDFGYESEFALDDLFVNPNALPAMYFSSTSIQTALNKLFVSNTEKTLKFMTVKTTVDPVSVTVGSFTKEVRNSLETSYSNSTTVVESSSYNYKLQYSFASEFEELTNLLFVDKLESVDENSSAFRGYYKDIDISYLDRNGVSLTTYYSVDPNVDIENINLANWSTTKPNDSKTITAVAVSCGTHVFKGSENVSPNIVISLTAPNGYTSAGQKAYNNSYITYKQMGTGENKKITSSTTEVELAKANISVTGTSSVGTGTSTNPIIVANNYGYSFEVKNNDSNYTFESIVLTAKLPAGLNIVANSDPNLSYDSATRTVSYTIASLAPNATKEISFDTTIDFESIETDAMFELEYNLSSLNGSSYNDEVKKLYNKLALPTLEFNKYAKTADSGEFSDEATLLIAKGETYKYRISVKNTSQVIATDLLVYDNVPEGLTVSNINNSGVYDGSTHKVTWNIASLGAGETVNLEYSVKVPDNISLGTKYRSSGHVTLINPLSSSNYLYDVDTNIVSTLYQMASDVKVVNTLAGALADSDKVFNYEATFTGSNENVGTYDVNDASGNKVGELNIDNNGAGSYNFSLKGSEAVEFKLLPGGINYVIKQQKEAGYETTISNSNSTNEYVSVSGITNEERKVTYTFKNSYNVSTSVNLKAKVKYEQGLEANMFMVKLTGNGINYEIANNDTGIVNFPTISYEDKIGQFTYDLEQVDTGISKVVYDTSKFKAIVNVENDGVGNLNATVKYYNANNEVVDDVEFENDYLPNGLVIQNINDSDYIDENKVFNYTLSFSSTDLISGSYKVMNANNEEIGSIDLTSGTGEYTFELKSNESISIVDIPEGINYVIKQDLIDYYTATVVDASYSINDTDNYISTEGVTVDGNIQIKFNNNYVTSGTFSPIAKVELEGKDIEAEEFSFMITDISEGITNGYTVMKRNNEDGEVLFGDIEYTRPGTYKYEIVQLSTNSNHIYYDTNKIILTVTLTDNEDGTMDVLGVYDYFNDEESFINKYSIDPIVPEEPPVVVPQNPNTMDKTVWVFILSLIAFALFVIERRVRKRRYELRG